MELDYLQHQYRQHASSGEGTFYDTEDDEEDVDKVLEEIRLENEKLLAEGKITPQLKKSFQEYVSPKKDDSYFEAVDTETFMQAYRKRNPQG